MQLFWIRILFLVSAIYDFVLGAAFIGWGPSLYRQFDVPAPQHFGYVHFCCLMLMIFGLMFLAVSVRPHANRNLIPFGVLLKAAYIGVTGYYWLNGDIPWVFKPFLFIDAAMLVGFLWSYVRLGQPEAKAEYAREVRVKK